jgi:hypothetical protein
MIRCTPLWLVGCCGCIRVLQEVRWYSGVVCRLTRNQTSVHGEGCCSVLALHKTSSFRALQIGAKFFESRYFIIDTRDVRGALGERKSPAMSCSSVLRTVGEFRGDFCLSFVRLGSLEAIFVCPSSIEALSTPLVWWGGMVWWYQPPPHITTLSRSKMVPPLCKVWYGTIPYH